jgi:hypothetical protein
MSRVSKRRARAEYPWEYRWTLKPHETRDGRMKLFIYLSRDRSMAVWDRKNSGDGFVNPTFKPLFRNGGKP